MIESPRRFGSVIAFVVDANQVSILGVFYGGQDYEAALQEESEE